MSGSETFISHLIELRTRLLRIVIGLALTFIVLFPFAGQIYTLLAQPLLASLPNGGQMIAVGVTTSFFVPMKMALVAAFIVSLPHTLYQIWAFIAPGLYAHERHFIMPLVVGSTLLFLSAWLSPISWYFP